MRVMLPSRKMPVERTEIWTMYPIFVVSTHGVGVGSNERIDSCINATNSTHTRSLRHQARSRYATPRVSPCRCLRTRRLFSQSIDHTRICSVRGRDIQLRVCFPLDRFAVPSEAEVIEADGVAAHGITLTRSTSIVSVWWFTHTSNTVRATHKEEGQ